MSAIVKIARDSHGVRLHLIDDGDIRILKLIGNYDVIDEGSVLHFTPTKDGSLTPGMINDDDFGLRSGNTGKQDLVDGRFGPWVTEVDLYNEDGFSVEVPPIHWLPWPTLHFCEGYCFRSQLVRCIAERIRSKADEDDKTVEQVSRNFPIPMNLRRQLSGETRTQLLEELAA